MQLKKFAKTSATNFSLTNGQFLDNLKGEAGGLFGKLSGLRNIINDKLNTVQPESRLFIENLIRRFLAAFSHDGLINILDALKGFGKEVIDMFDGLSKPIQDDILNAFPIIGSYVTNDITRLILRKLSELDLVSRTSSTLTPITDQNQEDSSGNNFSNSQFIKHKEPPANLDGEDNNIRYATTTHSLIDDEELLSVKKIVVNK